MYYKVRKLIENCIPEYIWNWYKHGRFEQIIRNSLKDDQAEFAIIKSLLHKNSIALDIGSNIGVYSVNMAQYCKKVYAIEPILETYCGLLHIIKKMKYDNIVPVYSAVSKDNGFVNMVIPVNSNGVKMFYRSHISDSDKSQSNISQEVMSIKLDDLFLSQTQDISFVKCDTEGHELLSLQGAAKIVNSGFSAWLVEINDRSEDKDSNMMKICSFFQNADYKPWILNNKKLHLRKKGEFDTNYFFLKEKHCQQLKQRGYLV
jgi:FkbM family methyltransferase